MQKSIRAAMRRSHQSLKQPCGGWRPFAPVKMARREGDVNVELHLGSLWLFGCDFGFFPSFPGLFGFLLSGLLVDRFLHALGFELEVSTWVLAKVLRHSLRIGNDRLSIPIKRRTVSIRSHDTGFRGEIRIGHEQAARTEIVIRLCNRCDERQSE